MPVRRTRFIAEPFRLPKEERRKKKLCLTEEQEAVIRGIAEDADPSGKYLIHGVTGSGKTEVYMELIARTVSEGKQAILLIPEISLTYQNVMRFYGRFGERVSVLHSRLSQGERYDQFERARSGDLDVMIGPRSALFTPFPNLGMIIIDEEHEPSYQSENAPPLPCQGDGGKKRRAGAGEGGPGFGDSFHGGLLRGNAGKIPLVPDEEPARRRTASKSGDRGSEAGACAGEINLY